MQAREVSVVWSWMAFAFNSCLGPGVIQFHVGLVGGVMSSAAVAVVCGAAELVRVDQQQKHRRLGFHF